MKADRMSWLIEEMDQQEEEVNGPREKVISVAQAADSGETTPNAFDES